VPAAISRLFIWVAFLLRFINPLYWRSFMGPFIDRGANLPQTLFKEKKGRSRGTDKQGFSRSLILGSVFWQVSYPGLYRKREGGIIIQSILLQSRFIQRRGKHCGQTVPPKRDFFSRFSFFSSYY